MDSADPSTHLKSTKQNLSGESLRVCIFNKIRDEFESKWPTDLHLRILILDSWKYHFSCFILYTSRLMYFLPSVFYTHTFFHSFHEPGKNPLPHSLVIVMDTLIIWKEQITFVVLETHNLCLLLVQLDHYAGSALLLPLCSFTVSYRKCAAVSPWGPAQYFRIWKTI